MPLVATTAGLVSRTRGQERCLPEGSRVPQMATDLRKFERGATLSYVQSTGTGFPVTEKMSRIVRRDVICPNHDRDYRSIALPLTHIS